MRVTRHTPSIASKYFGRHNVLFQDTGKMRKKQMKPSKIEKRYRKYTPEALLDAYHQVKGKNTSVDKAARMFGVPSQTLRDRILGHIDPNNFCKGGETMFTNEEEETIVNHVETLAELGYGYTNTRLKQLGGELAFELGKKRANMALSNNTYCTVPKSMCLCVYLSTRGDCKSRGDST